MGDQIMNRFFSFFIGVYLYDVCGHIAIWDLLEKEENKSETDRGQRHLWRISTKQEMDVLEFHLGIEVLRIEETEKSQQENPWTNTFMTTETNITRTIIMNTTAVIIKWSNGTPFSCAREM